MQFLIIKTLNKELKLRVFILFILFFFLSFLYFFYIFEIFFFFEQLLIKKKIIKNFFFSSPLEIFYQIILIYLNIIGIFFFFFFKIEIIEIYFYLKKKKKKIPIIFKRNYYLDFIFSIILSLIHTEYILKYLYYEIKNLNKISQINFINILDINMFLKNYLMLFFIYLFLLFIANKKRYINYSILICLIFLISPPSFMIQFNIFLTTILILEIKILINIFLIRKQEEWDSNP